MNIEQIARVTHEANRALCVTQGDFSQAAWDDAPDWQKQSAYAGVAFIINNPNALPSASHESWFQQKVANGWVYGEVKDPEAKTHPCMVPYAQLPLYQQVKDHLFGAVVRACLHGQ